MPKAGCSAIFLAITFASPYYIPRHDQMGCPVQALLAACLLASSVFLVVRAGRALLHDLGGDDTPRLPGRRADRRDLLVDVAMLAFGLAGCAASIWLLVRD